MSEELKWLSAPLWILSQSNVNDQILVSYVLFDVVLFLRNNATIRSRKCTINVRHEPEHRSQHQEKLNH